MSESKGVFGELFELELFGGQVEQRYRKLRPEVETMPWGTFETSSIAERTLVLARKHWTGASFQEHRTAIACAATLRALLECRAPIDLIAMAARFPLDELVHVELCAGMAMELGGGTEIVHDPSFLIVDADPALSPLMRAADLVTRCFCVGEALSIPLLRATWHAARHPLPRAVLGRIVKDEAAHGVFGFLFLDWALEQLSPDDQKYLGKMADRAVAGVRQQWEALKARRSADYDTGVGDALGWMDSEEYLVMAAKSLEQNVKRPLRDRGIFVSD
ncbi:MAG TPA: ferritin-like domain-containing protein [Polyangiaceae bacterium]